LSCRHTTLYTPVAWSYVAHLPLPITSAGDRSSDTPTATLPTLPTHRPSIRHAVSYRYVNRSGLETRCRAVKMSTHTRRWCAVAYVLQPPFFELGTSEMARRRPASRRSSKHRLPWRLRVEGQCTRELAGFSQAGRNSRDIERFDKLSAGRSGGPLRGEPDFERID
jgi:hypothetical protein